MPPKIKNNIINNVLKRNKSKTEKNKKKSNDSDEEAEEDEEEEVDEIDDVNNEVDELDDEINDEANDEVNDEVNDEDDNESYSDSSENNAKDIDNEELNDNYIENEETLSKKCYKKFLLMEDEINLEEIFGDDDTHIIKSDRLSIPRLTKYEMVRIMSVRTKQLAQGAKPMIKNYSGLSSKEIALEELKNKIIPLIIVRPIPNVGIEKWKLSELQVTF